MDNILGLIDDHPALAMFGSDANKENNIPASPIPSFAPPPVHFPNSTPPVFNYAPKNNQYPSYTPPICNEASYTPLMPIKQQVSPHPITSNPCPIISPEFPILKPRPPNHAASTPRHSKSTEETSGLPKDLPFPQCFSIAVERAIADNNVQPVRLKLMNDISSFYYGICKHPRQGDYCRIARKVCDRFPELKDVNSDKYWVSSTDLH